MKMILSTIVGSRLHGTHNEDSDYDYRGVFIAPLSDILSPFKDPKDTHWVEDAHLQSTVTIKSDAKLDTLEGTDFYNGSVVDGKALQMTTNKMDDTAYELRKFCKMAAQGNPTVLEVLVGEEYPILTEEGKGLRGLLPCFFSRKCYFAFSGYAHNQEKKFRECGKVFESKGSQAKDRKWKYASAHVRTLYQLRHLLKEKELIGKYPQAIADELKGIKEGRWLQSDIMGRIFQLEEECQSLFEDTWLPKDPDIEKIEQFLISCYV